MASGYDISASESSSAATGAVKFGNVTIGGSSLGVIVAIALAIAVLFFMFRKK